jgi:hypothetical protein
VALIGAMSGNVVNMWRNGWRLALNNHQRENIMK